MAEEELVLQPWPSFASRQETTVCASHMACSQLVLPSCLPETQLCSLWSLLGPHPRMPTLPPEAQPNVAPLSPISCPSASGSSFTLQLSWADPSIWASCGPSPEASLRGSTIREGWGLPKDFSVFCATASTACFRTWAVI